MSDCCVSQRYRHLAQRFTADGVETIGKEDGIGAHLGQSKTFSQSAKTHAQFKGSVWAIIQEKNAKEIDEANAREEKERVDGQRQQQGDYTMDSSYGY